MANVNTYGLTTLLDHSILNPNETAATVDSGLLMSGVLMDLADHNERINTLLRLFCETTTEYQLEVKQTAASRSQPVDEFGRAVQVKPPVPYTVAFPLIGSGNALGATYLAKNTMTVRDLQSQLSTMYRADYQWVIDHILAALFLDDGYTYRDIRNHGALTIEGLANGDAVTYYRQTTGAVSTDTHLLATASAIADNANPFPTIKSELMEHPDNSGEVITFIPTNLVSTATALAEFNSALVDKDIQLGANTDRLVGSFGFDLPYGCELKGKTDSGVWIVEWPILPDGYTISIPTAGRRPLARRVFAEAALQGFKSVGNRDDFPYFDEQWQRWEGYGGLNRVGAVVYRIGNGTYAVPTGYTSPMA